MAIQFKAVKKATGGALRAAAPKTAAPHATAGAGSLVYDMLPNGDLTFSLVVTDAGGNVLPVQPTGTVVATSSDLSVITVDPMVGLTGAVHVPVPAPPVGSKANITFVITWADATTPLGATTTLTWEQDIVPGPAAGVIIRPGVLTTH